MRTVGVYKCVCVCPMCVLSVAISNSVIRRVCINVYVYVSTIPTSAPCVCALLCINVYIRKCVCVCPMCVLSVAISNSVSCVVCGTEAFLCTMHVCTFLFCCGMCTCVCCEL